MKGLVLFGVICCLWSTSIQAENYAVIKGVVKGKYRPQEIQLMKVEYGVPVKYAGTTIAPNGSFAFMYQPDKYEFCYLYDGENYYRFYIKAGCTIELVLSDGICHCLGQPDVENHLLEEWNQLLSTLNGVEAYADFFPVFDSLRSTADEWLDNQKNVAFKKELEKIVSVDLLNSFINYLSHYQQKYESEERQSAYYQEIMHYFPISDTSLLQQPYGIELLQKYFSYKSIFVMRDKEYSLEQRLAEIPSDLLKAEYVICQADVSDYEHFMAYERKYFPILQTDAQRFRFQHLPERPYSKVKAGERAPNFIYRDTSGNYKSVADFKGKYKYIDIWATWCAPCKTEIPYLRELEKEFASQEIVFISISIDKNQNKWKNFVRDQKLGGIQLWAGDWDSLPEELQIGSVPRFMLIDGEGCWVDTNVVRPSNPELKKLLKKLLSKSVNGK